LPEDLQPRQRERSYGGIEERQLIENDEKKPLFSSLSKPGNNLVTLFSIFTDASDQ
jgi:hypothetical protein